MRISIRDNILKTAGKEEKKKAGGVNYAFAEAKLKEGGAEVPKEDILKFVEESSDIPFNKEVIKRIFDLNIENGRARYNKEEAFCIIVGSAITSDSFDGAKRKLSDIEWYCERLEFNAGTLAREFFEGIDTNKPENIERLISAYNKLYDAVEEEKEKSKELEESSQNSGYKSNEVVHDFGDGWKVVYVPSSEEMEPFGTLIGTSHDRVLEGNKNGLCLGANTRLYQTNSQGKIYSVRNKSNEPEVTIRIGGNRLHEAKGKNNNPPTIEGAHHAEIWFKEQEETLSYRDNNDYKRFPPTSLDAAKTYWNNGYGNHFFTKGWVVSWYNRGFTELDETTAELIRDNSALIIQSGLNKKYKELVEPVFKHYALEYIRNDDDTLFAQRGVNNQEEIAHEGWKTYKKNDWMIAAVKKLGEGSRTREHFLALGIFKIPEYREVSKNIIMNLDFGRLNKYKIFDDPAWKEECNAAIKLEVESNLQDNSDPTTTVKYFFRQYSLLAQSSNANIYLDFLCKNYEEKAPFEDNNFCAIFIVEFGKLAYSGEAGIARIIKKIINYIDINYIFYFSLASNNLKYFEKEIENKVNRDFSKIKRENIFSLITSGILEKEIFNSLKVLIIKFLESSDDELLSEIFNSGIGNIKVNKNIDSIISLVENNSQNDKLISRIKNITNLSIENMLSKVFNYREPDDIDYDQYTQYDEDGNDIKAKNINDMPDIVDFSIYVSNLYESSNFFKKSFIEFIEKSDERDSISLMASLGPGSLTKVLNDLFERRSDKINRILATLVEKSPTILDYSDYIYNLFAENLYAHGGVVLALANNICRLIEDNFYSLASQRIIKLYSKELDQDLSEHASIIIFRCYFENMNDISRELESVILSNVSTYINVNTLKGLLYERIKDSHHFDGALYEIKLLLFQLRKNRYFNELKDYSANIIKDRLIQNIENNNDTTEISRVIADKLLSSLLLDNYSRNRDEVSEKIFNFISARKDLSKNFLYSFSEGIDDNIGMTEDISFAYPYINESIKTQLIDMGKKNYDNEDASYAASLAVSGANEIFHNIKLSRGLEPTNEIKRIICEFFEKNSKYMADYTGKSGINYENLMLFLEYCPEAYSIFEKNIGIKNIFKIICNNIAEDFFNRILSSKKSALEHTWSRRLTDIIAAHKTYNIGSAAPSRAELSQMMSDAINDYKVLPRMEALKDEFINNVLNETYNDASTLKTIASKKITNLSRFLNSMGLKKEARQLLGLG